MTENIKSSIPTWVLIALFLGILMVLALCGDLFTFILGTIVEILVFAIGYNESQKDNH